MHLAHHRRHHCHCRCSLSRECTYSRFLGVDRPFGSNVVRVFLYDGRGTPSQKVVAADAPTVLPPVLI